MDMFHLDSQCHSYQLQNLRSKLRLDQQGASQVLLVYNLLLVFLQRYIRNHRLLCLRMRPSRRHCLRLLHLSYEEYYLWLLRLRQLHQNRRRDHLQTLHPMFRLRLHQGYQ